ncbi:DUF2281 domain-containing protein [candidate division KSB1 bacterium]|nr:DUF2281 domain-containing protein [candidate division KSB1 bacterium]MBL7093300.1 DUF2281 domain-containing protein [candidate division KSB1 bacterium]
MTTKTVSLTDAQKRISELLTFTLKGNEVIIAENDKQLVRITPVSKKSRIAGLNKGKIWMSNDFDKPLSDDFWAGSK